MPRNFPMKKPSALLTYLLPQPRDILFLGVFFSVIFGGPKLFSNDSDLGRHIIMGNYILETRTIPTHDIFSNTVYGVKFVPHEWLAQVILALAYHTMGLSGDVFLTALLASFTMLLVYNELIRRGNSRWVALIVTAVVFVVAAVHWLARPHMFTFFFLTLWTYWLERAYKNENKSVWLFPLLMLFWANIHGAFFAGFVIWGTYVVEWAFEFWKGRNVKEVGKRLIVIGLISFAVTLINPSGWRLWTTTVGYIGNNFITSHIVDHLPANFHEIDMWPFLFMIGFAIFGLAQEKRLSLHDVLLLAGWIAMGLHTVRNLPLFAVVTAPIYGTLLQSWADKISAYRGKNSNSIHSEMSLHGYVWIISAIAFFGCALWLNLPLDETGSGNVFLPDRMPVQAVDWLKENPQGGNMYNNFAWGGYILYRMWPDVKVFIDGQVDVYGELVFRDYLDVLNLSDGWEKILDEHDISWMLIPRDEMMARYLYTDDNWTAIYEDPTAVIFRRK